MQFSLVVKFQQSQKPTGHSTGHGWPETKEANNTNKLLPSGGLANVFVVEGYQGKRS